MKTKKIYDLVVGTNNAGKLREIKDLLPKKLNIFSPKGLKLKSPNETGKSFRQTFKFFCSFPHETIIKTKEIVTCYNIRI